MNSSLQQLSAVGALIRPVSPSSLLTLILLPLSTLLLLVADPYRQIDCTHEAVISVMYCLAAAVRALATAVCLLASHKYLG